MSDRHDCGGDAAAYVLGALDKEELEAFARHLTDCVVCRDEVDALRHVSDALAMAVPQYPASAHLRRQVMRGVRREPRGDVAARSVRRAQPLRWLTVRPAMAAGMAVVLAALVVGAVVLGTSGSSATNVFRASLGQAEVRTQGGHSELVVDKLSRTTRGHVYEVWLQRKGHPPTPANVLFNVGSDGRGTFGLPGSLHGVAAVLVTSEPAGGSPHPTRAPVIVTPLTKRA